MLKKMFESKYKKGVFGTYTIKHFLKSISK